MVLLQYPSTGLSTRKLFQKGYKKTSSLFFKKTCFLFLQKLKSYFNQIKKLWPKTTPLTFISLLCAVKWLSIFLAKNCFPQDSYSFRGCPGFFLWFLQLHTKASFLRLTEKEPKSNNNIATVVINNCQRVRRVLFILSYAFLTNKFTSWCHLEWRHKKGIDIINKVVVHLCNEIVKCFSAPLFSPLQDFVALLCHTLENSEIL